MHTSISSTPSLSSVASTTSDRKSTRLNSSHSQISYAVFCLKKKQFRQTARDVLSDEDLQPQLRLDHQSRFFEMDFRFLRWHDKLPAFGIAHSAPSFYSRAR